MIQQRDRFVNNLLQWFLRYVRQPVYMEQCHLLQKSGDGLQKDEDSGWFLLGWSQRSNFSSVLWHCWLGDKNLCQLYPKILILEQTED